MKEKDLIKLGFERVDITVELSGCDKPWYYYSKDIGNIDLLSCESDSNEAMQNKWQVNILECNFVFTKISELKKLISILERNKT